MTYIFDRLLNNFDSFIFKYRWHYGLQTVWWTTATNFEWNDRLTKNFSNTWLIVVIVDYWIQRNKLKWFNWRLCKICMILIIFLVMINASICFVVIISLRVKKNKFSHLNKTNCFQLILNLKKLTSIVEVLSSQFVFWFGSIFVSVMHSVVTPIVAGSDSTSSSSPNVLSSTFCWN